MILPDAVVISFFFFTFCVFSERMFVLFGLMWGTLNSVL